jgi:epoxyqueuosine reductase
MDVIETLRGEGMPASMVSVGRLQEVRHDIEELLRNGELDRALYDAYLSRYAYSVPDSFPEALSVVVIAAPSPTLRVRFMTAAGPIETLIPPTYANGRVVDAKAKEIMTMAAPEARFERAFLPLKTMATHSGLMRYGRNNIGYVPRLGSFFRLTAFFTDLDMKEEKWGERERMPACRKCTKCVEACPTGAIERERFLVHAERCLTFLNELPAENGFPSWVRSSSHNALIGCMLCQKACPYDKSSLDNIKEGPSFSEAETRTLLDDPGGADPSLVEKLESVGLETSVFPRNLRVLMGQ